MNVLMLGRNALMLQMGSQPLTAAGHTVTTTLSDDETIQLAQTGQFGALIFGMAVEHASRQNIRAALADLKTPLKYLEPLSPADLGKTLEALKSA